jgi:hypothetical protein
MQHVAVHVAKAHARRAGLRMTTRVREQKRQAAMSLTSMGDVAALRTRTVTRNWKNSLKMFQSALGRSEVVGPRLARSCGCDKEVDRLDAHMLTKTGTHFLRHVGGGRSGAWEAANGGTRCEPWCRADDRGPTSRKDTKSVRRRRGRTRSCPARRGCVVGRRPAA